MRSQRRLVRPEMEAALSIETQIYIQRVESDGGTVINPGYVSRIYDKLIELNLLNDCIYFVSARAGIKKDAENRSSRLYSLIDNGTDIIQDVLAKRPVFDTNRLIFDGIDDFMSRITSGNIGWDFEHTFMEKSAIKVSSGSKLELRSGGGYLNFSGAPNLYSNIITNAGNNGLQTTAAYSSNDLDTVYDTAIKLENKEQYHFVDDFYLEKQKKAVNGISIKNSGNIFDVGARAGTSFFNSFKLYDQQLFKVALTSLQMQEIKTVKNT